MATAEQKLAQIVEILSLPTEAPPADVAPPRAYDLPPITADQAVTDSVTVNKDGSLWTKSQTFSVPGQAASEVPVVIAFGYISPAKTPEIWDWARAHMVPEGFAAFDAAWKANPFGLYRADPRALIRDGVLNLMTFSYLVEPFRTFVQ